MTSRINCNRFKVDRDRIQLVEEPDFMTSEDPWFRPVDIQLGADGALYVADFYNKIIGHYEVRLDHPDRDRTSGRIWRIVYRGKDTTSKPLSSLAMPASDQPFEQLVKELDSTNSARRQFALEELCRPAKPTPEQEQLALQMFSNQDAVSKAPDALVINMLWSMLRRGGVAESVLESAFRNASPIRQAAVFQVWAAMPGVRPTLRILRCCKRPPAPLYSQTYRKSQLQQPVLWPCMVPLATCPCYST